MFRLFFGVSVFTRLLLCMSNYLLLTSANKTFKTLCKYGIFHPVRVHGILFIGYFTKVFKKFLRVDGESNPVNVIQRLKPFNPSNVILRV